MHLGLSAVRHADEAFASPVTTPLSAMHCTIGRGQECDIVLEDPTRHVSRKHATIIRQGDAYVIWVNSQINPVIVNGQPVPGGQQRALVSGDRVIIGEYEFCMVPVEDRPPAAAQAPIDPLAGLGGGFGKPGGLDDLFADVPPRAGAPASKPVGGSLEELFGSSDKQASDPLLDILSGNRSAASEVFNVPQSDDPLAHILGQDPSVAPSTGSPDPLLFASGSESPIDALLGGTGARGPDPLGLSSEAPRVRSRGSFGGGIGGSDELDHVHDVHLPLPPSVAQVPAARTAVDIFSPAFPPASIPERPRSPLADDPLAALLGEALAPAADPLGLFAAPVSEAPPARSAAAFELPQQTPAADPLGLFAAPTPEPLSARSAPAFELPPANVPDTATEPYVSIHVVRSQAPPDSAPTPSAPAAPAPVPISADPIRAFLRGAGMAQVDIPDADAEAFIEECGATVRAAIEGLMGMLLARAKLKEELRAADRTMVAARENNPLKLIETVDEALRFVFDPATRTSAFLPPPKAVADACSDLQVHEMALVAGMRAALLGAIKRFEPAALEKRFEKDGSRSLLANKKAQLWDRFLAFYEQTQKDADDNFDRVFGSAFLRAYQEQVRRLRA